MQRVEAYRYKAECLEGEGVALGPCLAADLAQQWRQLAEQVEALADDRQLNFLTPLRWNPTERSRSSRS